jgi:hypothetical protein
VAVFIGYFGKEMMRQWLFFLLNCVKFVAVCEKIVIFAAKG